MHPDLLLCGRSHHWVGARLLSPSRDKGVVEEYGIHTGDQKQLFRVRYSRGLKVIDSSQAHNQILRALRIDDPNNELLHVLFKYFEHLKFRCMCCPPCARWKRDRLACVATHHYSSLAPAPGHSTHPSRIPASAQSPHPYNAFLQRRSLPGRASPR
jgi:hypothetical protein